MNIPTNCNSNRDTFVTFIKRRWQLRAQAATPWSPAATCSAQIRGVDLILDLHWIDVVTARDHHVLGAAHEMNVAVRVDPTEIASNEEAVRPEFLRSLFPYPPVAAKDVWALDLDDADLPLATVSPLSMAQMRTSTPGSAKPTVPALRSPSLMRARAAPSRPSRAR
jgi:hypothetical protein